MINAERTQDGVVDINEGLSSEFKTVGKLNSYLQLPFDFLKKSISFGGSGIKAAEQAQHYH